MHYVVKYYIVNGYIDIAKRVDELGNNTNKSWKHRIKETLFSVSIQLVFQIPIGTFKWANLSIQTLHLAVNFFVLLYNILYSLG
jgi:hypothetical protein